MLYDHERMRRRAGSVVQVKKMTARWVDASKKTSLLWPQLLRLPQLGIRESDQVAQILKIQLLHVGLAQSRMADLSHNFQ